ncbi:unnamed protein product [Diatraea saccharalis]|uniref:Triglyceride lipase n=1 Tax=Diatraea saccharalis TaxID=40085 RepID=A0A9N9WFB8_9NEOP|nr:unnamed protein product [Diatraea saccharalis]
MKNESNIFDLVSTEPKDTGAFVVSQQLFNLSQPIQTDDLNKKLENLQLAREKEAAVSLEHSKDNVRTEILSNISNISTGTDFKSNSQPVSFFTNFPTQDSEDAGYLHNADSSGFGSSYFQSGNDYKETLKKEQEDSIDVPRIDSTAMPLFGLPNVFTESPISNIGSEVKSVSLYGAVKESQSDINIGESLTDDTANQNKPLANDSEAISDFNICETCREVNVTDDKDKDDLTTQLIENVTAPIQLLNPVIVPLTESSTNNDDADFEPNQCAEISHITEETIETIQVQTATELLDDEDEVRNLNTVSYGWNTTNSDTSFHPTEALLDHDFNFKIDPNAIGFFSNNSLFFEDMPNNASDEIKAEFKNTHEESPVFVPNIPTAPPAEDDDTKSDETGGIDVHSIEQDAKMDFPIYEEFVIEPSETDDDKIEYRERERSSEDPIQDVDTFTNRVERFKKMEETVDKADNVCNVQKNTLFDMNVATSPAITIASYFDTGNYAAETHYRNSISSPSSIFNVGSPNAPMRIPPGFEEEYKRRMSVLSSRSQDKKSDKDENILYIPETSTQTKPVITTTYSMISNKQLDITVTSTIQLVTRTQEIPHHDMVNLNPTIPEITTLKDDILENTKPLVFSSVSEPKPESADNLASQLFTKIEKQPKMLSEPKLQDNKESDKMKNLADPLTFFSSKDETPNVATDNNFNRLASYFTSPPKTDHGKSFFELSQSQNHYRHANYDTSTHDDKLHDIPNDGYLNNLIRDLTSSSNLSVNAADQIVRTVNYFTIEYDNDKEVKSGLNISEPDLKKLDKDNVVNGKRDSEYEESNMSDDKKIMTVVSKCKLCCNNDYFKKVFTLNKVALDTDFKVRTFMDNTDGSKDSGMDKKADMDNSKDDRGREVAVTFDSHEESAGVSTATESRTTSEYIPVKHHWFYRVDVEGKSIWRGFSATDSGALEDAFVSPDLDERTVVATDGGRFDVNIVGRLRTAVYWAEKPTNVRRCSWFYKGTTDARYVPYTEAIAEKLEEEYRRGITSGQWHRRLVLPSNSLVVMHGPAVMVHLAHQDPPAPESSSRPRVVRRGCDECEVEDAEPSSIDHLLLLCHGVGSACDMRFRSLQEVVDDFRATSLQLLQGHYRNSYEKGVVNRVEVLPISWHDSLHSGETGVDRRLAAITLDSIPRLRSFTNDTVLDVLFYTSPVFCQTIIDTVCAELNRIYSLFMSRTPGFKGRVSVGGHSLGSVILYDLLCHQQLETPQCTEGMKSYVEGAAGTGQGAVRYPSLTFRPDTLYALGSPIAMFECIRGVKSLGANFKLPTCENFFNIFHPYDPIAYRIEPLINTQLGSVKPFLIPHHKGRKRMHLELKDTMARVGADIKQKLIESLKSTWSSMWKTQPPPNDAQLEKVVEEEMEKEQLCSETKNDATQSDARATPELLGNLNGGRRIDYVLQETPLEMINEYLFAMSSHVCYWESEDTMLLILREIYDSLGVAPDSTVPQQSMTVQRQRPAKPVSIYCLLHIIPID